MPFLAGDKVVNKRNGNQFIVVTAPFDGSLFVVPDADPSVEPFKLGAATVKRWYRLVSLTPSDVKVRRTSNLPPLPKGEKGIGFKLRRTFETLLKSNVPTGDVLEQKFIPKSSMWVYKLNGQNIFECTESKYRFSVLVNPKTLSPALKAQAYVTYPKERHWVLATRFVFTEESQRPLMKQVVLAGIYSKSNRK